MSGGSGRRAGRAWHAACLGAQLLHRVLGQLTPAVADDGLDLVRRLARVLALDVLDDAAKEVDVRLGRRLGRVRLGAPPAFGTPRGTGDEPRWRQMQLEEREAGPWGRARGLVARARAVVANVLVMW